MNPVDHPHGGGEGRSPIGRKSPMSPWGKPTLGFKTRKKNKASDKFIVRRRKNNGIVVRFISRTVRQSRREAPKWLVA